MLDLRFLGFLGLRAYGLGFKVYRVSRVQGLWRRV